MCFQSFDNFCVIEYAYNYITVVLNQSNQEFLNDVHVIIFTKKESCSIRVSSSQHYYDGFNG